MKISPGMADAWYARGLALARMNRTEDALKSFDKAIEIKPSYAKAWYNKGVALKKLDRSADAKGSFDQSQRAGIHSAGPSLFWLELKEVEFHNNHQLMIYWLI